MEPVLKLPAMHQADLLHCPPSNPRGATEVPGGHPEAGWGVRGRGHCNQSMGWTGPLVGGQGFHDHGRFPKGPTVAPGEGPSTCHSQPGAHGACGAPRGEREPGVRKRTPLALCAFGQVTSPFWASAISTGKWAKRFMLLCPHWCLFPAELS